MSDLATEKKISFNIFSQVIGKIFSTVLGLIAIGLITRYLGQEGFGNYTTVMAYLQIFAILADFGLSITTAHLIAQPNANESKLLNNVFSFRVLTAFLFLGLAPLIVVFFPYPLIVKLGIAITTFSFFFITLYQIFVGVFQKYLTTHKIALSENLNRALLIILIYVAIAKDWGLLGIMAAITLSNLSQFISYFSMASRHIPIRWEIDLTVWKQIIAQSWPIAVNIVFNVIYFRTDALFLSLLRSQTEVGLYGAPYKIVEVLTTFPFLVSGLLLPLLTFYWKSNNRVAFKEIFQKYFDFMVIITIPMVVGAFLLAKPSIVFIAGTEFEASAPLLRILIFSAALIFINNIPAYTIVALEKQKNMIPYYGITALIALSGYLYLIPKYSFYAAAGINAFSEFLITIATFWVVYKAARFIPSFKIFLPCLFASSIMALTLYILIETLNHRVNLAWLVGEIFIGMIVYFAVLLIIKQTTKIIGAGKGN
ncbi:MAG: flippase [Parcubacteria group bacterium]|nr:flippase [Parcubacteria group bacterium]